MEINPRLLPALLEGIQSLEALFPNISGNVVEIVFAPPLNAGLVVQPHHTEWCREAYPVHRDDPVWGMLFFFF